MHLSFDLSRRRDFPTELPVQIEKPIVALVGPYRCQTAGAGATMLP
jgi:hypothetical protein